MHQVGQLPRIKYQETVTVYVVKVVTNLHFYVKLITKIETNTRITKELKITPILDKLLEYKRNWIQHVNRMPRNRLPRVMKHYAPTGRRNHGRPLKRLLHM